MSSANHPSDGFLHYTPSAVGVSSGATRTSQEQRWRELQARVQLFEDALAAWQIDHDAWELEDNAKRLKYCYAFLRHFACTVTPKPSKSTRNLIKSILNDQAVLYVCNPLLDLTYLITTFLLQVRRRYKETVGKARVAPRREGQSTGGVVSQELQTYKGGAPE